MTKPDLRFLLAHPVHFLALGFGSGLAPRAPGTFGTLAAFPLFALWLWLGLPEGLMLLLTAFLFVAGVPICTRAARSLGAHDPGAIVWDEIVAMLLVLIYAPPTAAGWLLAFALFRLFDIVKPWPIRVVDARVGGGLGVMLDDLFAAVFALAVQAAVWRVLA